MKTYSKLTKFLIVIFAVSMTLMSCKKDKDDDDDVTPTTVKSSEKQLLTFVFNDFSPAIAGVIDQNTKTISATVPADADLTTLVPTITISAKASITPASGISQNFTNPVNYTITAEDGTTAIYTVTVTQSVYNPETLNGTMSANRTLTNQTDGIDYIIDGQLYIDGNALLTIEAGVKIIFTGVDGSIYVGSNAGLKFAGTAENPIILSGPINNQNKGSWGGVIYTSSRSDNTIDYTYFENGGAESSAEGTISIGFEASAAINNSSITNSATYGLIVNGILKEFSGNIISDCDTEPIFLYSLNNAESGIIDNSNTFENNAKQYITVYYSSEPEDVYTLSNPTIPYYFEGGLIIDKDLTIEKGTSLLFGSEMSLEVFSGANLIANGDATNRITFTGLNSVAGYWSGLVFSDEVLTSTLSYCDINYAGNTYGWGASIVAFYNLSINNSSINNSYSYGAIIGDNSNITHNNVSFTNCADGNVYNYDSGDILTNFP